MIDLEPHGMGDRYAEVAGLRSVVLSHISPLIYQPAPAIYLATTSDWGYLCPHRFMRVMRWLRHSGLVVTTGRSSRYEYKRVPMSRRNGYAEFSQDDLGRDDDGNPQPRYRYELGGDIGESPLFTALDKIRIILWIMLNPSTADAMMDDQTIATIVRFSERWGYHRIMVGNLYAFRTKHPKIMWTAHKAGVDIVGPQNDEHLLRMIALVRASGGEVMAAWGKHAKIRREQAVHKMAGEMKCLSTNLDGTPVHPLYQPGDLVPRVWEGRAA